MKHKVITLDSLNKIVGLYIVRKIDGDSYIDVDLFVSAIQKIKPFNVTVVKPNRLRDVISNIERHLNGGGVSFVHTLNNVSNILRVSRPTLNEWSDAGVLYSKHFRRTYRTDGEKTILGKYQYGYDLNMVLNILKEYANTSY